MDQKNDQLLLQVKGTAHAVLSCTQRNIIQEAQATLVWDLLLNLVFVMVG